MMKRWAPWILCSLIAAVAALSTLLLARQSDRLRAARDELRDNVQHYCGNLASELQVGAETLKERIVVLRRASSPDELQRAEHAFDLALPMGAGISEQRAGRARVLQHKSLRGLPSSAKPERPRQFASNSGLLYSPTARR